MSAIVLALLPSGLLIFLGASLRRSFAQDVWQVLDTVNFKLLFPALIFYSAASRQPSFEDIYTIGAGALVITVLGALLVLPLRKLKQCPTCFLDYAAVAQTSWRFNTAVAMVAVQVIPENSRALMSIAIGFAVPTANILAVLILSRGKAMSMSKTLEAIVFNPFLIASIAGLLASTVDFPQVLDQTLASLASSATPLALLSIGASVNLQVVTKLDVFSISINAIKLILLPAVTLLTAMALGMSKEQIIVLTLFAALPTASSAHLIASAFGANRNSVATVITQSTLLACISLPLWMNLVV